MNEDKNIVKKTNDSFKYNWPKFKDEKPVKIEEIELSPQSPSLVKEEVKVVVDSASCHCCGLNKEKSFPNVNGSQICPVCKRASSEDQRIRHGGNKNFNN